MGGIKNDRKKRETLRVGEKARREAYISARLDQEFRCRNSDVHQPGEGSSFRILRCAGM